MVRTGEILGKVVCDGCGLCLSVVVCADRRNIEAMTLKLCELMEVCELLATGAMYL